VNALDLLTHVSAAAQDRNLWTPEAASTGASRTDALFYFILYLSAFFFLLVIGTALFFAIKYRRRGPGERTSPLEGNRRLEIIWSVIPAIFFVAIFAWGFRDYLGQSVAPGDALDIRVTAQKWFWSFDYPKDGINTSELVVPVGQPVRLTMSSLDVIHSFYVPAFRLKRDVLPNRYSVLWFEPTQEGTFDIQCAEYCGTSHSQMLSKVRVVSEVQYQEWINSGGGMSGKGMTSEEFGKVLFKSKGCATCHTVDGSKKTGPSFLGKAGSQELLKDGSQVTVDDNYLRESIMEPGKKVVQGYEPVMPTYSGRLTDKQINAIIDYLKSLGK
jgi:cytochrome c oxidase subunit II